MNRGIRLRDLLFPHRHFLGVLALQGPHAAVHADELEDEAPAELFRVAFDVPAACDARGESAVGCGGGRR